MRSGVTPRPLRIERQEAGPGAAEAERARAAATSGVAAWPSYRASSRSSSSRHGSGSPWSSSRASRSRTDLSAKTRATHERIRRTTTPVARIGGARLNTGWFREFLDYDPRPDLQHLTVPTLALTGRKDVQTPPEDLVPCI